MASAFAPNHRDNRSRPCVVCPLPGCGKEVGDLSSRDHLKRLHPDYDPASVSRELFEAVNRFLWPLRKYDRARSARKRGRDTSPSDALPANPLSPSDAQAANPLSSSVASPTSPPSPSDASDASSASVRHALAQLPVAHGAWLADFKTYLVQHVGISKNTASEYGTLVARLAGHARRAKGLGLSLDTDAQVDEALLDPASLASFKSLLCTGLDPTPSPAAIRKHLEALDKAAGWRCFVVADLEAKERRRRLYDTLLAEARLLFKPVRKQEALQTRRKNVVQQRIARGKHVAPAEFKAALQKSMIADWLRWIHRPQTVRLRDEWMRMLGIVFATFGSHHPNRNQALTQLTLRQYLDAGPDGILFEGKTELSHGPQVLCLAPRVKEILGDYIDHFRPLATKDPESPLLVTHTGSKLNSGTPGEALRAWCAASLGPAVCLTPTDVFKIFASNIADNDPDRIEAVVQARGTSLATFQRHYRQSNPHHVAQASNQAYENVH